eukprot:jgi/Botrbrau1/14566/Bobra.27_3s0005.1
MTSLIEYINPEGLRLDGRRPREARRIECELGILPHADGSAVISQGNTKVVLQCLGPEPLQEGGGLAGPSLGETLIHTNLGRTQIDVQVQVLQMDVGMQVAALNAAMLAIASAGIPVVEFLGSASVVCIDDTPLLDPNYQEMAVNPPEMLLACHPSLGKVIVLELEGATVHEVMAGKMLELAQAGAATAATYLNDAVLTHMKRLAHAS